EASLAGKLKHPHIASILDAVVQENSGYIAMELVSGGELSKHTKPGKLLPVEDVLQIGFKCCGALDYAFKEGIVHRDIKPANIMLAQGTNVKIADFGAAYLRKSVAVQTASMGSPYYVSPEQIQNKNLTFHSDMYSLGVVLYELLTGQRPFTADSMDALMKKITEQQPTPPTKLRKELPKEIDAILFRALAKKPEQRYKTWHDFSIELSTLGNKILPAGVIPDSEKYVAVKKVPMLSGLSDAELWELALAGKWTEVPAKKTIMKENEKGLSFFLVGKGQVKVTRKGRLLNTLDERECFGEMAYIRGGEMPRHATVESVTELLLAEFEPATLAKMSLAAQLHLTRALVRNLVERLEAANTRVAG
ncbi:MAG TPA: serine/threonine-protein kinase, partial [Burkholderiales bacterium]|nr:serine/threonine-protein kinase [Burkholderiales bacterium]